RKKKRSWREKIEKDVARWWEVMQRRAAVDADPINPEYVVHALDGRLPDDAIVTADSGSAANWYARHLRMRGRMRGSLSGTLATMGPGVPYAIGAKFAHPERPAIALVGDGAMQMNGMMEMVTAAKYWQGWSDPRLIVAVLNNRDLNQVTWEMRAMSGAPQFEESQHIPDLPYAEIAQRIGLEGVRVEKPEQVEAAWDRALTADRPFVIDFRTDPAVPPIPPHAELDQIEAAAFAVLKGDSDRASVVKQGFKAKVQEMLPGTRHRGDRPGAGADDSTGK
ncbi:thiamine pyrophosphate-dependent enzyme, partial [Streptomyces sp. NPDC005009]